jgi:single-strand DNA-binding protein
MANLNKVMLIGNLTRDPELRYLQSGTAVCDFGLAVNRSYRTGGGEQKEEVLFIDVTAFGKQAEIVSEYLQKGRPVFVEGRLRLDQWTGNDGQRRSKINVVLENFQFLDSRGGGGGGGGGSQGGGQGRQRPPQQQQRRRQPANRDEPPPPDDFDSADDSIPF